MARGPLRTEAELRRDLAKLKAKYDELADEVRAAVDALEADEPPRVVARRLRRRVKFGGRPWSEAEILAAAWEWAHRYDTSPTTTDWNPALLRAKDVDPVALERYVDGEWPSTATVMRRFGTWRTMLEAAGLPANDDKVGRQRRMRGHSADGLPEWLGWELVHGYRERARIATYADLARRSHLAVGTVSRIERGALNNPPLRVFLALAVGLDVRPAALLEYRTDNGEPE